MGDFSQLALVYRTFVDCHSNYLQILMNEDKGMKTRDG